MNNESCIKSGYCKGALESKLPDNVVEFAVPEFSDLMDTQRMNELNVIGNLNANLAVGDSNYDAAEPPLDTTVLEPNKK